MIVIRTKVVPAKANPSTYHKPVVTNASVRHHGPQMWVCWGSSGPDRGSRSFYASARSFPARAQGRAVCFAFVTPAHTIVIRLLRYADYVWAGIQQHEVMQMPAKSEKQRKFMGAELARKRAGKKTKTGMSESQLEDFAEKGKKKKS